MLSERQKKERQLFPRHECETKSKLHQHPGRKHQRKWGMKWATFDCCFPLKYQCFPSHTFSFANSVLNRPYLGQFHIQNWMFWKKMCFKLFAVRKFAYEKPSFVRHFIRYSEICLIHKSRVKSSWFFRIKRSVKVSQFNGVNSGSVSRVAKCWRSIKTDNSINETGWFKREWYRSLRLLFPTHWVRIFTERSWNSFSFNRNLSFLLNLAYFHTSINTDIQKD